LIFHGVFEKYPTLTVMIKEFGLSWLPNLIWKLDENYDVLRMDSPWVKRWPSEYVHDHIKLSTQPIEASARNASAWVDLVATVDGIDDILCFSSDYPHYSFDDPHHIGRLLPTAWVRKIFYENACRTYGWQFPAGVEEQPAQIT
jgi:predicted TIM-barrel fold metal-dependent hydrolase